MKKLIITVAVFGTLIAASLSASAQTVNKDPRQRARPKIAKEGVGLDGIVVGRSTAADVIKKFGKPLRTVKYKKYSTQLVYPGGISYYHCQSDRKQVIFDIEMRAPFYVKTSKGIALSRSTLEDVYKIYGKSKDGLEYRGVSFFYAKYKGRNIVTVIDIVENGGIRQCKEAK